MHPSLDEVIFTWGKYKGQTLGSVLRMAPQYLQWIVSTPTLPANWIEAAKRALSEGDVSDLSLPRTKLYNPQILAQPTSNRPVELHLKDTKTAYIIMPYNKLTIEQFKYEIDGRVWNSEEKYWEFPAVHLPKAKKLFPNAIISDDAMQLLDKLQERRTDLDEIRHQTDNDVFSKIFYNLQRIGRIEEWDKWNTHFLLQKYIKK